MKKNILGTVISALVIALLVWIASKVLSFSYVDWSFFIGLGISVIVFFFNSRGGVMSKGATLEASEAAWKVQKDNGNELEAEVGYIFYGSLLFTIVSLVWMLITYF
ncbi:hypothetical protein [Bacillus sp. AK031]